MDYKRHYNLLIQRGKERTIDGYKERHHIVPKCLGGNNSKENLVDLTPEEHYVAHQLLVKMYPEEKKLVYALSAMCMSKSGVRNNKMYGWIKKKNSLVRKQKVQTMESNNKRRSTLRGRKTSAGMLGKTHSAVSKNKSSVSQKGRMKTTNRTIYAWLRSPLDEEILFGPLIYECKKYNLVLEYTSRLCKGKSNSYKGWTFLRPATNIERDNKIEHLKELGLMI